MTQVKSSFILSLGVALLPFSPLFCMEAGSSFEEKESPPHQESTYQAGEGNRQPEELRADLFECRFKFDKKDFENYPFLVDSYVPQTREKSRPQVWREAFFSSWTKTLKLLTEPCKETKESDKELGTEQEKALDLDCKTVDGVSLGKIIARIRKAKEKFLRTPPTSHNKNGGKSGPEQNKTARDYLSEELNLSSLRQQNFLSRIESICEKDNALYKQREEVKKKANEKKAGSFETDVNFSDIYKNEYLTVEKEIDPLLSCVIFGNENEYSSKKKEIEKRKNDLPSETRKEELEFLTQVAYPSLCHAQPFLCRSEEPSSEEKMLAQIGRGALKSSHVKKYNQQIEKNNAILRANFRAHALTTAFSVAGGGLGGAAAEHFFSGYMLKKGEELEEAITPYLPQWIKESPALLKTTQTVTRNSLRVATDGVGFLVGAQLGHMAGAFLASMIWGS